MAIPRIIHQIQEEGKTEAQLLELSQTWIDNHPKWQYKLWNIQSIEALIKEYYPDIVFNVNIRLSEIARYLILHKEGGLFVENDFECIEPFDDIIKEKSCFLSLNPNYSKKNSISESLIISKKRHPFLHFIISYIKNEYEHLNTREYTILNEIYEQYQNKQEIELLHPDIVNPCTEAEIYLYHRGLITDEDMEEKISEAKSICYYKRGEYKPQTTPIDERTDVLYLSYAVENGGAFRAARRIHLGLRGIGLNSKMLVLHSHLNEEVNLIENIYRAIPEAQEKTEYNNDLAPLKNYSAYSIDSHSFTPGIAGTNIDKYIDRFEPKIIQLHWINGGFIKIEDLGSLKNKIVWRLADCWPITGGCYYFGNCQRYLTGCGKCPKLGSDNENDLSREIWLRKEKAWKNMDMTIVVPTPWMKKVVEDSTLLKGKDIFVIPNGLDLNKFYPIDKEIARKALNIPMDKKVILYGATNAINDQRKGFQLLLKALDILPKENQQYLLVVFGADPKELCLDIPVKFMGYVHDHYILQTLYSAADIMVVPSLEEAFGQTVTEAMACATPTISFQGTGPAGIIEHKRTGYLARYADFEDLAEGIQWLLEDNSRLDSLSCNAKNVIETTYDIKIIANQYKELYEHILKGTFETWERGNILNK